MSHRNDSQREFHSMGKDKSQQMRLQWNNSWNREHHHEIQMVLHNRSSDLFMVFFIALNSHGTISRFFDGYKDQSLHIFHFVFRDSNKDKMILNHGSPDRS